MTSLGLDDDVGIVSSTQISRNVFNKCYDHVNGDILLTQNMLKQLRSEVVVHIDIMKEYTKEKINNCEVHYYHTENNISIVENNLKQLFGANFFENNYSLIDSDEQLKDHEVFAVLNDESNDINNDVDIKQSKYGKSDNKSQIHHFKASGFSQIIFKTTFSHIHYKPSRSKTTTRHDDLLPNTNEIIDLTLFDCDNSDNEIEMKRTMTQHADVLPNTDEIIDLTLFDCDNFNNEIKMKRKRKERKKKSKLTNFIDLTNI